MTLYDFMVQNIDYEIVIIDCDYLYLSVERIASCDLSNLNLSTSNEVQAKKNEIWNDKKWGGKDWERKNANTM